MKVLCLFDPSVHPELHFVALWQHLLTSPFAATLPGDHLAMLQHQSTCSSFDPRVLSIQYVVNIWLRPHQSLNSDLSHTPVKTPDCVSLSCWQNKPLAKCSNLSVVVHTTKGVSRNTFCGDDTHTHSHPCMVSLLHHRDKKKKSVSLSQRETNSSASIWHFFLHDLRSDSSEQMTYYLSVMRAWGRCDGRSRLSFNTKSNALPSAASQRMNSKGFGYPVTFSSSATNRSLFPVIQ